MRGIKFRAWANGEMYYESFKEYMSGYGCMFHHFLCPDEIMQFTGLHDSAGKEIYEGDIFKSSDYPFTSDGNTNYLGVIVYHDDDLAWYYDVVRVSERVRGGACGDMLCQLDLSQAIIIGNIYQNANLLQVRDSDFGAISDE